MDEFRSDIKNCLKHVENQHSILDIFISCLRERRFTVHMFFEQILGYKDLNETRLDKEDLRYIFDVVETNISDSDLDEMF